jgi:hypothetical protein
MAKRRGRRWARGINVRPGALSGWHDNEPVRERHRVLTRAANRDGPGEVSRRLNFLSNVANRRDNKRLHRIARADQKWVVTHLKDEDQRRWISAGFDYDESMRRGRSKPIRVRGSRRARRHRRRRAR